jgi:hypothetical protein
MKARFTFLAVFTFLFCAGLLYSCKKSGCTDVKATNHTSGATDDDGSCLYYSDAIAGTWLYEDTTEIYSTGSTYDYINSDVFRLEKLDNEKVLFKDYKDGTIANVYEKYMTIVGSSDNLEISADKRTIRFANGSKDGFGYYVKQ